MIYTLPFIAAIIGWVTNFIAIKMLFHPRKPVKVLFVTIQGIFPKRQKAIAERLGHVVANELFSFNDLKQVLVNKDTVTGLDEVLGSKIDDFLDNKLPQKMPMLALVLNKSLKQTIKSTLLEQFEEALPAMIDNLTSKLEGSLDIEKTVSEKVAAFSTDKLEQILFSILKKEFRFIEVIGAVLGFLIGVAQLLMLKFGA